MQHPSTLPTGKGDSFVSTLWRNVRYGARRLAATPGFTATAVLSLALGIGANTAIFTLIDAVLLRDVPFRQPDELVNLYIETEDFPFSVFSYPDFEDLRDGTREVFADLSATRLVLAQTDRDGNVEMLPGEAVTGTYFTLMGIGAAVGRTFTADDDVAPGGHPVVMLSHRYWQSAFGRDETVVGRSMRLGGRPYTVVGVVAADYDGNFRGIAPAERGVAISSPDTCSPRPGRATRRRIAAELVPLGVNQTPRTPFRRRPAWPLEREDPRRAGSIPSERDRMSPLPMTT